MLLLGVGTGDEGREVFSHLDQVHIDGIITI